MKNVEIFKEGKYSFNIMPLLDVIFLLTIFYILTVTFQKEEKVLPIHLPVAEQPILSKMENAIVVEVDEIGHYYFEHQKISASKLEQAMSNLFTQYSKDIILIRSSESTDINHILRLTDIARKVGIEKISIAVKEP